MSVQDSWFSIHPLTGNYPEKYMNIGDGLPNLKSTDTFNDKEKYYFARLHITDEIVDELLLKLNLLGINYRTLFPDLSGLCKQIEWESKDYEFDYWN